MGTNIVQYIILRGDLLATHNWSLGALIAQACHACCAVTHLFQEDEIVKEYFKDLDNMHKIVLEAPDDNSLKILEEKLNESNIKHKLWVEQPENIPTCLAVKPYPKNEVQLYFKQLKLFKVK